MWISQSRTAELFAWLEVKCLCSVLRYLDDEGLVLEARGEAQHAHIRRFVDEVLDAVENSTAGGRDTPVDPSLADGLSCHACMRVDVLHTHAMKT